MLSVVIPTLDAESTLPATLAVLGGADEVIVVDGGSADATAAVARTSGATVLSVAPSRGRQLGAGAKSARGDWLLFLHADTVPEANWRAAVGAFMASPANVGRAAVFRFALDDAGWRARWLERAVAWRGRLGLPYGDQGLVISRAFYDRIGGFRPLPLMEDVDLVRRIGRANLVTLPARAVTSAARYRREGYARRALRNLTCLALWHAGVSAERLARRYG